MANVNEVQHIHEEGKEPDSCSIAEFLKEAFEANSLCVGYGVAEGFEQEKVQVDRSIVALTARFLACKPTDVNIQAALDMLVTTHTQITEMARNAARNDFFVKVSQVPVTKGEELVWGHQVLSMGMKSGKECVFEVPPLGWGKRFYGSNDEENKKKIVKQITAPEKKVNATVVFYTKKDCKKMRTKALKYPNIPTVFRDYWAANVGTEATSAELASKQRIVAVPDPGIMSGQGARDARACVMYAIWYDALIQQCGVDESKLKWTNLALPNEAADKLTRECDDLLAQSKVGESLIGPMFKPEKQVRITRLKNDNFTRNRLEDMHCFGVVKPRKIRDGRGKGLLLSDLPNADVVELDFEGKVRKTSFVVLSDLTLAQISKYVVHDEGNGNLSGLNRAYTIIDSILRTGSIPGDITNEVAEIAIRNGLARMNRIVTQGAIVPIG